jgi:hypothetical protein
VFGVGLLSAETDPELLIDAVRPGVLQAPPPFRPLTEAYCNQLIDQTSRRSPEKKGFDDCLNMPFTAPPDWYRDIIRELSLKILRNYGKDSDSWFCSICEGCVNRPIDADDQGSSADAAFGK